MYLIFINMTGADYCRQMVVRHLSSTNLPPLHFKKIKIKNLFPSILKCMESATSVKHVCFLESHYNSAASSSFSVKSDPNFQRKILIEKTQEKTKQTEGI